MKPPGDGVKLRLENDTAARIRLRFSYDAYEIWDTWLCPGARMQVPDLRSADIGIVATFSDPDTHVLYSVPLSLAGRPLSSRPTAAPVRVVAKLTCAQGASAFELATEPLANSGELDLLNLAGGAVSFGLRFLGTPFALDAVLAAQARFRFRQGAVTVAATVNGYTTEPLAIAGWDGRVTVALAAGDQGYPVISSSNSL